MVITVAEMITTPMRTVTQMTFTSDVVEPLGFSLLFVVSSPLLLSSLPPFWCADTVVVEDVDDAISIGSGYGQVDSEHWLIQSINEEYWTYWSIINIFTKASLTRPIIQRSSCAHSQVTACIWMVHIAPEIHKLQTNFSWTKLPSLTKSAFPIIPCSFVAPTPFNLN